MAIDLTSTLILLKKSITSELALHRGDQLQDVRIWRMTILTSKVDPRIERGKIHNIGIQMKQKELTETFRMIIN